MAVIIDPLVGDLFGTVGNEMGQHVLARLGKDFQTSMTASPTNGDVKSFNKLARQIKSQPVKLQYWPLTGPLRTLGFPDASYRNNDDDSSQRGMTVFLAESRERS